MNKTVLIVFIFISVLSMAHMKKFLVETDKVGADNEDDDYTADTDNYSAETKKEILKSEEWWKEYYD